MIKSDEVWRLALAFMLGFVLMATLKIDQAPARDSGQYAASPLKGWFDKLHSRKGPCCSDADGSAVSDADWKTRDGHYVVRVQDQWVDVPEEAVITEPNLVGRTMVWPSYINSMDGSTSIIIRCFMPGEMS
jgi:hypothetical protein